jgi:hypothetical protein
MRFPLAILASAIAAFALGTYLTIPSNPEVRFWREVVKHREADIAQIRKTNPEAPIIFFTGGSSCAFSIDPKIIEETCGLPAVNLGLPVAAGGKYLLHQALAQTRAGDILVICLEPDILTNYKEDGKPSRFSFIMSAAAGTPSEAAGGETFEMSPTLPDYLNFSRPGSGYLTTRLAKAAVGRGYRYTEKDLRYHGRTETEVRDVGMQPFGISQATCLSPDGREFLKTIARSASNRQVRVVYAMPWHFTAEQSLIQSRANRLELTGDIGTIMPAIDDGYAGAVSDPSYFSDSPLHLTAEGSALRSQAIGAKLQEWLASDHSYSPVLRFPVAQ